MIKRYDNAPENSLEEGKNYSAIIKTSKGDMTLELFTDEVPITTNNFIFLAREGFYENGCFHRIIKDFMVQGGCPRGTGSGGPGYQFNDEAVTRPYTKGTLAMANAGPNTNGSQFFIVHGEDVPLPPNYTIFGLLTDGGEVLESLANAAIDYTKPSGEQSIPAERLTINTIEIIES
ncbi:MAG TPA: peptidylprolyl isomerase [Dehalococcoidia bacterium]|jgi:cyclophilin family peptidyl-prolyl cis-trans isomerase|nr:peptidylprolyl isomerase [Dehalococcoidia bacterium]|tara:strand:- start:3053 stop:3580 length:528 start_codon:yes stop_codon:yes gene_type:complete